MGTGVAELGPGFRKRGRGALIREALVVVAVVSIVDLAVAVAVVRLMLGLWGTRTTLIVLAAAVAAGAMLVFLVVAYVAIRWQGDPPGLLLATGRGGRRQTVVTPDGMKLHAEVDGPDDAPVTAIFVHGITVDLTTWREQRSGLTDPRVRRVFYDHRGHGRSGETKVGTVTLRALAEDLHEVMKATAPAGPVVLVGHSMGGMTIMALAGSHPELFGPRVQRVVLVSTSCGDLTTLSLGLPAPRFLVRLGHRFAPGLLVLVGTVFRHFVRIIEAIPVIGLVPYLLTTRLVICHRSASPAVVRTTAALIAATPPDTAGDFIRACQLYDERESLPALSRVPTLILTGEKDRLVPMSHSELLAREIPGSTLFTVPNCGHMIVMEHPEVVNRQLAGTIASVSPAVA